MLARLMQACKSAFEWVRYKFNRDAFLKEKFAECHRIVISYFDTCKQTDNTDPACIQIAAMMQTPSFDTLMDGGHEADASVIFCVHQMSRSEIDELFAEEHRDFWYFDVGFNKTVLFNAITMRAFDERVKSFEKSQWAQRLSPELVELVAHAYGHCERAAGTPFMAFLTQSKMTGGDWLHAGLNTTRDNALCMTDAVKQYKRLVNKAVRKRLLEKSNIVD
jgi:hypothetical protein